MSAGGLVTGLPDNPVVPARQAPPATAVPNPPLLNQLEPPRPQRIRRHPKVNGHLLVRRPSNPGPQVLLDPAPILLNAHGRSPFIRAAVYSARDASTSDTGFSSRLSSVRPCQIPRRSPAANPARKASIQSSDRTRELRRSNKASASSSSRDKSPTISAARTAPFDPAGKAAPNNWIFPFRPPGTSGFCSPDPPSLLTKTSPAPPGSPDPTSPISSFSSLPPTPRTFLWAGGGGNRVIYGHPVAQGGGPGGGEGGVTPSA